MYSLNESNYEVKMHKTIVLTCHILYSYLIGIDPDIQLLNQVDWEIFNQTPNLRIDDEDTIKQIWNSLIVSMSEWLCRC